MSPRHIFSFSSVLLCVALTLPSFAQKFTGDIAGDLTDATGAMLPRATVTAQNLGTGEVRKAITSGSGSYRIPDLTVGKYKVTATAEGFKTLVREVDVAANAVTHTDFKMQIGHLGLSDLTRTVGPLPELDGLLSWIACIGDARPVESYIKTFQSAGLTVEVIEDHSYALTEMVWQIQGRLLGAEIEVGLKKLTFPDVSFSDAKRFAQAALSVVKDGKLGYALIDAAKPR